jgi:adenylate kinase
MNKKPCYLFFGLPGSGKSVQAKLAASEFDFKYISAGNVSRQFADKNGSQKQKVAWTKINQGQPLNDDLIEELIKIKIEGFRQIKGLVLDNFPFNKHQLKFWENTISNKYNFNRLKGILLDISPQTALDRLSNRFICSNCNKVFKPGDKALESGICPHCQLKLDKRADDSPSTVGRMVDKYKPAITFLKEYFVKNDSLIEIDGEKSIKEVSAQVMGAVKKDI